MRLCYMRLFLINLVAFLILGCSSEPQSGLELTLIVDGKKQISESVKGDAVQAVTLKYKNLIDSFTDFCNKTESVAEHELKLKRLKGYLNLEFQMIESAHFTIASEVQYESYTDKGNDLEVRVDSKNSQCTKAIRGISLKPLKK